MELRLQYATTILSVASFNSKNRLRQNQLVGLFCKSGSFKEVIYGRLKRTDVLLWLGFSEAARIFKHNNCNPFQRSICSPFVLKLNQPECRTCKIFCALPETAASVAVAATIVGAAATLLKKRSEASEKTEASTKVCDDCGGSGVCPECKGEGFVLKKLSDESAERARLMAKNAATRYTAGLPKKWSYCAKCSSSRSCSSCAGTGKVGY